MALILIAEDDPGTRKLLSVVLERSGHDVLQADNGLQAWEALRTYRPDVVVSDINMPRMNGMELLERVRSHPELATTPMILLTSLQERRDVRLGMSTGADDYIGKPFAADELLAAVSAQLNRNATRAALLDIQLREALDSALQQQARKLGDDYEQRLAHALNEQWPGSGHGQGAGQMDDATVLCLRLEPVRCWADQLGHEALALVLRRFHESVGDSVFLFGALHLFGGGHQLLAVFFDPEEQRTAPHPLRALRAAFAMRQAEAALDSFAASQRKNLSDLPMAHIHVGMHAGPVAMIALEGLLGGVSQVAPAGAAVLQAEDLAMQGVRLGRRLLASASLMRRVTGAARQVERQLLSVDGRDEPLDVCVIEPAGS